MNILFLACRILRSVLLSRQTLQSVMVPRDTSVLLVASKVIVFTDSSFVKCRIREGVFVFIYKSQLHTNFNICEPVDLAFHTLFLEICYVVNRVVLH